MAGVEHAGEHAYEGGCHCGNLRWALRTRLAAAELPARACQCSFCRKHGALTISDPAGTLRLVVQDPGALLRYRFATRTADFLVCTRCGIYVGAEMAEGGRRYGIVNLNTSDARAGLAVTPQPMDYAGEDAVARRARRAARWTPLADG